MYGLAVGELFLLPGMRRIALMVLTVAAAFLLNLARTYTSSRVRAFAVPAST